MNEQSYHEDKKAPHSHYLSWVMQCVIHMHRLCYRSTEPDTGQMWGGPKAVDQAFHIPLTDHGCKCAQVQNNSETFLWLSEHSFPEGQLAPAGPHLECAVALYRCSLSLLLDCPVNMSNWSDPAGGCCQMYESVVRKRESETGFGVCVWGGVLQGHPTVTAPYLQAGAPTQGHQQGESVPTFKQASSFPSSHLFSMLVAGYNL